MALAPIITIIIIIMMAGLGVVVQLQLAQAPERTGVGAGAGGDWISAKFKEVVQVQFNFKDSYSDFLKIMGFH